MPSKQVTDKEKSARAVASAADTHAAQAASALEPLLSPYLKSGEKLPDIALLCALISRRVTDKAQAMVEADRKHETELGDDKAPRDARDGFSEKLGTVIADLRDGLAAGYGAVAVRLFGLDGTLPTDPSVVATLGASVIDRIESGEVKLPAPRRKGLVLDLAAFAEDLRAHLLPLQKALADVAHEEKEANASLHAKQTTVSESDETFTTGARVLSATFSMAGLKDIARKVRPSRRRPGRTVEPIEDEPPEDGGPTT